MSTNIAIYVAYMAALGSMIWNATNGIPADGETFTKYHRHHLVSALAAAISVVALAAAQ